MQARHAPLLSNGDATVENFWRDWRFGINAKESTFTDAEPQRRREVRCSFTSG
jgi:hypothetical protein